MNNEACIKILLEHDMTKSYILNLVRYNVKDKLSTIENNYNRQIQHIKSDIERKFNEEVPRKIMETVPLVLNDSRNNEWNIIKTNRNIKTRIINKSK